MGIGGVSDIFVHQNPDGWGYISGEQLMKMVLQMCNTFATCVSSGEMLRYYIENTELWTHSGLRRYR